MEISSDFDFNKIEGGNYYFHQFQAPETLIFTYLKTKTDIFGYNAVMSVVLNENMDDATRLATIQMLIDKGCDVNWLNYQCETALTLALERVEIDIANLLLDNGSFLYRN